MATFNDIPVTLRFNRPSPTGKTLLEFQYLKGGVYQNPNEIQSVHIFRDTNLGDSSNWLDLSAGSTTYGLIADSLQVSAVAAFTFQEGESGYTVGENSIYERSTGKYAVVLEEGMSWVDASSNARTFSNAPAGKYWDIWTVRDIALGDLVTYIHSFELFEDSIISLTEPLMVTTSQRLVQKYINKNSKTDLHITSSHTVTNSNITPEVKNIFNNTILDNAAIRIIKLKDDTSTGTPYEEVLAWTSTGVIVNSDDTIIYGWDTADQAVGTYELQVSSTFLNQNVMSDKFNLVVR
jgi:hypothetical protein